MASAQFYYGSGQPRELQKLRPKIAAEQQWKCHWCNTKIKIYKDNKDYRPDEATLDHVTPRNEGGTNDRENIVVACKICNTVRSGSLPPVRFRHLVTPVALMKDPKWF